MPTKLARKALPPGLTQSDFTYQGRPAKDQGDFGDEVGIADLACVNQFGETNASKHYHGGVVQSGDGRWWCYFEWGRIKAGNSWNGCWTGNSQDYQFYECADEADARKAFAKQLKSKNLSRLEEKDIAGTTIWAAKVDKHGKSKDGYIVRDLATRDKGLPDAYKIKDEESIGTVKSRGEQRAARAKVRRAAGTAPRASAQRTARPSIQPQVVALAKDLVGGTKTYTRSMVEATGVTPTLKAIEQVRDKLVPAAMQRIKDVGADIEDQVKDTDLVDISKMVSALVPRPIPRSGVTDAEAILSGGNILALQADLDAFEASLMNEDFSFEAPVSTFDPNAALNAVLRWIDPKSEEGRWLWNAFVSMSNDRHGYLGRGKRPTVKSLFAVSRPDRDARFDAAVARVAAKRKGRFSLKAKLQPKRTDLGAQSDLFKQAGVALAIHGTRPVNIAPIMGGNFRLPKSLPGAQITGANFGHGIYFATDWRKSYGYTGRGYYGGGGAGGIKRRGCFMFLCDMIVGDAYRAPRCGSWSTPPSGKDSVFGVGGDRGHSLQNDEHVIFDPNYQRIRYVVEFGWMN